MTGENGATAWAAALLLVSLGCVGEVGEATTGPADPPVGGADGTPAAACAAAPIAPVPAPMRRLTRDEYNNTVRDLLADKTRPADQFPLDDEGGGVTGEPSSLTVSSWLAEGYMKAAETLAANAVGNPAALLPCAPAGDEEACARKFVETTGLRAFRRPLQTGEVDRLMKVYDVGRAAKTFAGGIQLVLRAMLQSPHFIYRLELAGSTPVGTAAVLLTPYEMASRLSYLLWRTMPDERLFAAAAAGKLVTPEEIEKEARRMLADARARPVVVGFHERWLGLEELGDVTKDPKVHPEFGPALRTAMHGEIRAFVEHVVWQEGGRLEALLTAPTTFVNALTAPIYGVPAPAGGALTRVDLQPAQRAGLLTQLGLLATHAKPNQSSPVHRGKFVRERLLCTTIPDPPPDLMVVAPDPKPGLSTRRRFDAHSSVAACAGCHTLMDPIGFGFEHYDGIGRWREMDQSERVDASGALALTRDIDGPFRDATELAAKLAGSAQVRDCVVAQWFRFAHGRTEADADRCSLSRVGERFAASGLDLRELVVALTQTDAFTHRRPAGSGVSQ